MIRRRGEQRVAVESAVNQLIFFSCSSLGVVQWLLCGDGGLRPSRTDHSPFPDLETRLTIRPSRLVADPGRRRRTTAQDKKPLRRRSPPE